MPSQTLARVRNNGPEGPFPRVAAEVLRARFAPLVNPYGRPGLRRRLNAMLLPAKIVRDVPMIRLCVARDGVAPLHVACLRLLVTDAEAANLRARRAACHRAADRRDRVAASTAHLVSEHAADHGADQR